MFKKTLNFSDLKSDPSLLAEMTDDDVFQIFHRGHDVKVVMTQERFFNLMARLEKAEGSAKVTSYNSKTLLSEVDAKIARIHDLLSKQK